MNVKDDILSSLQQKVGELEVKVKTRVNQQKYFDKVVNYEQILNCQTS